MYNVFSLSMQFNIVFGRHFEAWAYRLTTGYSRRILLYTCTHVLSSQHTLKLEVNYEARSFILCREGALLLF